VTGRWIRFDRLTRTTISLKREWRTFYRFDIFWNSRFTIQYGTLPNVPRIIRTLSTDSRLKRRNPFALYPRAVKNVMGFVCHDRVLFTTSSTRCIARRRVRMRNNAKYVRRSPPCYVFRVDGGTLDRSNIGRPSTTIELRAIVVGLGLRRHADCYSRRLLFLADVVSSCTKSSVVINIVNLTI